ncbi:hypothetical protein HNR62_002715 [Oceanisphaera litoralis]|uniref:pirin family protein n=1 Tax=Oceanisphaera litoralis TaxID=225144 RepID=UPI00195EB7FC|nr:pirin family protein [Oceanisphaera litoralis]MBM7456813.1 hypothetical protein [Oceanisphaera litoralis]
MSTLLPSDVISRSRSIERIITGRATSDGAGVTLTRYLDAQLQQRLDPFLMLDAFGSDDPDHYSAGFPDHPHRGFETITYMLQGRMLHRDSEGNEGLLESGGVQWMNAGRGVIHSEMPQQIAGRMAGFQLWLNLPSHEKMTAPWYRDLDAATIPRLVTDSGAHISVIAGSSHGVQGAVQRPITAPLYLDVHLPAGSHLVQQIPPAHNAFIQLYQGEIDMAQQTMQAPGMAILNTSNDCDGVRVQALQDSRFLLIAGQPLREPIEQYGPFVMNTKEEIYQAVQDFRHGRLA